jgi:hypothetical protein
MLLQILHMLAGGGLAEIIEGRASAEASPLGDVSEKL